MPDAVPSRVLWQTVDPAIVDCASLDGVAVPEVSTTVRALWSRQFLYLRFDCPYTSLTTFDQRQQDGKRAHLDKKVRQPLQDRDVVEALIGAGRLNPSHYAELEVAPTNERLDVMVNLPEKDLQWTSGFESAVRVDHASENTIRGNAGSALLACRCATARRNPTMAVEPLPLRPRAQSQSGLAPHSKETFHVPDRFGALEFSGRKRGVCQRGRGQAPSTTLRVIYAQPNRAKLIMECGSPLPLSTAEN